MVDQGAHRVRWVDASGVIHPVMGTGRATNVPGTPDHESWRPDEALGEGGPAEEASLRQPSGALFDGLGRLWVSDGGNHRIRRIDLDGACHTVVGPGGIDGDALEGISGEIAATASLTLPDGMAWSSDGDLLCADYGGARVYRIRSGP